MAVLLSDPLVHVQEVKPLSSPKRAMKGMKTEEQNHSSPPKVDPSMSPTRLVTRSPADRDFTWSTTDEPHATRRRLILAAHPEITRLFEPEWLTCPLVVVLLVAQVVMAYLLREASWWLIFPLSYVVGGTLNHSLQLAVHELSHNLCFHEPVANRWLAIAANLATGFPSSVSFQKYHMDHHQFQGYDGVDTDIPTVMECDVFEGSLMKLGWVLLQPLFYAIRPTIVKPKPVGKWEFINVVCQLSFNFAVLHFLGIRALGYLLIGTVLGLGLHPVAGHFIAEHYEFVTGQETYSYYGWANLLNFNVGYHNEHHDFPRVPWSRLPAITKIAPEFYLNLPHYTSYFALFSAYINDERIGPFARIKRQCKENASETDIKSSEGTSGMCSYIIAALLIGWFLSCLCFVLWHSLA